MSIASPSRTHDHSCSSHCRLRLWNSNGATYSFITQVICHTSNTLTISLNNEWELTTERKYKTQNFYEPRKIEITMACMNKRSRRKKIHRPKLGYNLAIFCSFVCLCSEDKQKSVYLPYIPLERIYGRIFGLVWLGSVFY